MKKLLFKYRRFGIILAATLVMAAALGAGFGVAANSHHQSMNQPNIVAKTSVSNIATAQATQNDNSNTNKDSSSTIAREHAMLAVEVVVPIVCFFILSGLVYYMLRSYKKTTGKSFMQKFTKSSKSQREEEFYTFNSRSTSLPKLHAQKRKMASLRNPQH